LGKYKKGTGTTSSIGGETNTLTLDTKQAGASQQENTVATQRRQQDGTRRQQGLLIHSLTKGGDLVLDVGDHGPNPRAVFSTAQWHPKLEKDNDFINCISWGLNKSSLNKSFIAN
jgi:hypothetical protein